MIVQTTDKCKLVIFSKKMVDDNKKVGDNWVKAGTQSLMYSYTLTDDFGNELKLSSKSDEFGKYINQEVYIQFKLDQFGMKSPTTRLYAMIPVKK